MFRGQLWQLTTGLLGVFRHQSTQLDLAAAGLKVALGRSREGCRSSEYTANRWCLSKKVHHAALSAAAKGHTWRAATAGLHEFRNAGGQHHARSGFQHITVWTWQDFHPPQQPSTLQPLPVKVESAGDGVLSSWDSSGGSSDSDVVLLYMQM